MRLLDQYTKAQEDIARFKLKHALIFKDFEELNDILKGVETNLRAEALHNYEVRDRESTQNGSYVVKVIGSIKRFYDYKLVKKYAKPAELKKIEEKAVEFTIKTKEFEKLVEKEEIPVELERKVYHETKLTPRVIIRPIVPEKEGEDDES